MNCDSATNSAYASGTEFETRGPRFRVTDVTLPEGRQTAVRGFSLATLAAALAACGGGGGGSSAPQPTTPPPAPANNPPTATDASGTAVEDGEPATGGAVGSDSDGDALTYTVTADGMYGSLAVADDGSWTYTIADSDEIQALGAGATLTDTATIEVSDGEATAMATVTITIEGANDDPTGEDGMGAVTAGMDMAAMGNVNAMDVDMGDTHTYEVGDAPAYGTLTVDEAGNWSYMADSMNPAVMALAEGETMEDTGTIVVMDSAGGSAMVTVTVTITGVDDAPSAPAIDTDEVSLTISEGDSGGRNLGTLSAADPEGGDITYSVDDDRFEIETVGGTVLLKLKVGEELDHESTGGSVTVMVTAMDAAGNTSEPMAVTITVTDVNEAPTITFDGDSETPDGMPAVSTVMEHTGDGEFMPIPVGQVMAMDPDQEIMVGDIAVSDSRFSLMEDAFGGIWLMLNEPLDRETDGGMVTVMLTVTDSEGLMASTEAMITVTDVNDAPTIMVREGVTPAADGGMGASGTISENTMGPVYEIIVSDADEELDASHVMIDDDRFEVTTDSEGGLWAFLSTPVNFEEVGDSIDFTVTVTDSGGASASASATVTIRDINDAPAANQDGVVVITGEGDNRETSVMPNLFADAGTGVVTMTLDLGAMFSDEDGNTNFRYTLDNQPYWLELVEVQYGLDGSVIGLLRGTVPVSALPEEASAYDIAIVATDQGGGEGRAVFNIIADDGNDEITDVHFNNEDGSANEGNQVMVPENDGSGMVLGMLTADDQDDPRHPNGMHTFTVNNPAFEAVQNEDGDWLLKVKDDTELNFEASATINVVVTAMDGGGSEDTVTVYVNVGDMNDAPTVVNQPGNWWVTVDEDLDADDVVAGQWLTFNLEVEGDMRQLFDDVDAGDNGMLSYEIVNGPSWLMINDMGALMNVAGMLPERGIYDVTVRATDGAGASVTADSFKIAVVISDANNGDNDEPNIRADGVDIMETATAGTVVGRFTVEDEDLDVAGIHPWGDVKVHVTASYTAMDGTTADLTASAAGFIINPDDLEMVSTDFQVVEVGRDGNSIDYELRLTPTGAMEMDFESVEEVDVTVYAYDGTVTIGADGVVDSIDTNDDGRSDVEGADIDEFSFEIEDVNEAPALVGPGDHSTASDSTTGLAYAVTQQAEERTIYLNLTQLFRDPEGDHDEVTFTASISDSPWISLVSHWNEDEERETTGPVMWGDIKNGRDEDEGTADDVDWGPSLTDGPADDDYVLILEVDRDGMEGTNAAPGEIGQDNDGMITITAMDEDGASSTANIAVTITDQNLDPDPDDMANDVTLSDMTPRQGQTITVRFDESVDPDFTGPNARSPVAVIYQVINSDIEILVDAISVDEPARYTVTSGDVGDMIEGKVIYYEVAETGRIVISDMGNAALETASAAVQNRLDPASGTITFSTTQGGTLEAMIVIVDEDGFDENGTVVFSGIPDDATYTWQWSENGRGGWQEFDANGANVANSSSTAIPEAQQGKYVRLVTEFTDSVGTEERIVSDTIKVGAIASATAPTFEPTSGGVPVGRTLRVDLDTLTPQGGSAEAEWFVDDGRTVRMVGTGSEYRVTEADRGGQAITVRVTSMDSDGGVTSIVTTDPITTVAALPNTPPLALADEFTFDLGPASAAGELVSNTIKVNMASLFEDIEGGLSFSFDLPSATNFIPQTDASGGGLSVFLNTDTAGVYGSQLLIVNQQTGEIDYRTNQPQRHAESYDTDPDAGGNAIELVLTARDPGGESATVNVNLRIDAAPTGFRVSSTAFHRPPGRSEQDPNNTSDLVANRASAVPEALLEFVAASDPSDVYEAHGSQRVVDGTMATEDFQVVLYRIDVQDLNMADDVYGKYSFEVSDDRFEAVPLPARVQQGTGLNDPDLDIKDTVGADDSQVILRLKAGETLDLAAELANGARTDPTGAVIIDIAITATPVSANFDPITLLVSVVVYPKDDGLPVDHGANTVPGLKDDEMNDDSDETDKDNGNDSVDDGEDDDEDGGTPAPMDAMADFISGLDDGMF